MYEVFFNDRVVFIGSTFKKSLTADSLVCHISDADSVRKAWEIFKISSIYKKMFLISDDSELIKKYFFNLFKIVMAAGGLVRNNQNQLLCIYRWGKWDLPKGKIEKGEEVEDAALREVEEECGIQGVVLKNLNSITYHIYENQFKPGVWVLKPTYWYNMVYEGCETLSPQVKEDILKAQWFDPDKLDAVVENTWISLVPLFKSVV